MKEMLKETLYILICLMIFSILFYFNCKQEYELGYKEACKDFYNGKLRYDLIENPDGSREWKKMEKVEKARGEE